MCGPKSRCNSLSSFRIWTVCKNLHFSLPSRDEKRRGWIIVRDGWPCGQSLGERQVLHGPRIRASNEDRFRYDCAKRVSLPSKHLPTLARDDRLT
ncbi:hypothetical protein NPIL_248401 [Nephila pilipes]|uniref:Uncharacterized protein n=1 Tax=Nephila pilipes TaxID=299642 RepID=A0A8X6UFS8_NEPPI|nr:hypothetical protein NPIL_248401 [Nephila pilipes]